MHVAEKDLPREMVKIAKKKVGDIFLWFIFCVADYYINWVAVKVLTHVIYLLIYVKAGFTS